MGSRFLSVLLMVGVLSPFSFLGIIPAESPTPPKQPDQAIQIYLPYTGQSAGFQESLSGLVFKNDQGLWVMDSSGNPRFLIDQPTGRLSPDGSQVVYWYSDGEGANDVWLADLSSSKRTNLTRSKERIDRFPEWWPARPGLVIFGSQPAAGFPGGPSIGNLASIRGDGSGYHALDDEGGPWSLSPGGNWIAYGGLDGRGNLFHWGAGSQDLVPAEYGVTVAKLFQPAWSPDEKRLAWSVTTDLTGTMGLAIFDLNAKTGQVRHRYAPQAGPVELHYLAWSPDGDWLAFVAWSEEVNPPEGHIGAEGPVPVLWAIDPNSDREVKISQGFHPIWSADGAQLAYTRGALGSSQGVWVVQAGAWVEVQVLPPGSEAVDWILPTP